VRRKNIIFIIRNQKIPKILQTELNRKHENIYGVISCDEEDEALKAKRKIDTEGNELIAVIIEEGRKEGRKEGRNNIP